LLSHSTAGRKGGLGENKGQAAFRGGKSEEGRPSQPAVRKRTCCKGKGKGAWQRLGAGGLEQQSELWECKH